MIGKSIYQNFEELLQSIAGEPHEGEEYISPWLRIGMFKMYAIGILIGIPFWYVVDNLTDRFVSML